MLLLCGFGGWHACKAQTLAADTLCWCSPLAVQVVLGRNGVESFLPLGPLSEFEQEVRCAGLGVAPRTAPVQCCSFCPRLAPWARTSSVLWYLSEEQWLGGEFLQRASRSLFVGISCRAAQGLVKMKDLLLTNIRTGVEFANKA